MLAVESLAAVQPIVVMLLIQCCTTLDVMEQLLLMAVAFSVGGGYLHLRSTHLARSYESELNARRQAHTENRLRNAALSHTTQNGEQQFTSTTTPTTTAPTTTTTQKRTVSRLSPLPAAFGALVYGAVALGCCLAAFATLAYRLRGHTP